MKQLSVSAKNKRGQTLVTLLMFVLVAMTVVTSIITIVIGNNLATTESQQGDLVYYVAESGAENALLRLVRDPTYTGETLNVSSGTATITVSGSTITSVGTIGNLSRKIQVLTSYNNNQLVVTSWKEIQ